MADDDPQPIGFDTTVPGLTPDAPKPQEPATPQEPEVRRAVLVKNPDGSNPDPDNPVTETDIKDRLFELTNRAAEDHEFGRRTNMELMQRIDELSKTPMPDMPQLEGYPQAPGASQAPEKQKQAAGL